jgi:hypothetical protein
MDREIPETKLRFNGNIIRLLLKFCAKKKPFQFPRRADYIKNS